MSPNHSPQHRLRIRARDRSSDCVSSPSSGRFTSRRLLFAPAPANTTQTTRGRSLPNRGPGCQLQRPNTLRRN